MSEQGAMRQIVRCSIPSRTREEDLAKETEAETDEADMVNRPERVTPTIGKRLGAHHGSSVEGGAICRIRVYNGRIHTVPLDKLRLGHLCKYI